MGVPPFLAKLRLRWLEALHCRLGSYHQARGDVSRAREHYLIVLHFGESYRAHMGLAALYLEQQKYALALDELLQAKELNPSRFGKQSIPAESMLLGLERIPPPHHRGGERAFAEGPGMDGRRLVGEAAGDMMDPLPFGDFANRDEADRFAVLPPLHLSDADDVDWDLLGRKLLED